MSNPAGEACKPEGGGGGQPSLDVSVTTDVLFMFSESHISLIKEERTSLIGLFGLNEGK
jgi:hypothetical protein